MFTYGTDLKPIVIGWTGSVTPAAWCVYSTNAVRSEVAFTIRLM